MITSRSLVPPFRPWIWLLLCWCLWPLALEARPKGQPAIRTGQPLYVFFIDQLRPQGAGPAFNGLDERRRGPIFNAALQQVSHDGKLPGPVVVLNRDLSLPATVPEQPPTPTGSTVVRIFLTQWSQDPLGGMADAELLCRFYAQVVVNGKVGREIGPFFARQRLDVVTATLPEERWGQFQAVARKAIAKLAAALR